MYPFNQIWHGESMICEPFSAHLCTQLPIGTHAPFKPKMAQNSIQPFLADNCFVPLLAWWIYVPIMAHPHLIFKQPCWTWLQSEPQPNVARCLSHEPMYLSGPCSSVLSMHTSSRQFARFCCFCFCFLSFPNCCMCCCSWSFSVVSHIPPSNLHLALSISGFTNLF